MFKDYVIIENNSSYVLEQLVKEHLLIGWEPQGGISYFVYGGRDYYSQAMVKL